MDINDKAPEFTLPDQNGDQVSLKDFRGKWVVLYFYPRADTPGCTIEACEFRDSHKKTEKIGAVVLGISPDTPTAQKKFEEKFDLPFTLLGDADKKVCNLYGVIQEKNMYGKKVMGVVRTTFIIGPDGKIKHIFHKGPLVAERSYFAAVVVNVKAASAGITASSLPVATATPVPAPAPTPAPMAAPLPPPASAPISAPAAAPPPIFVALLLVWPFPLAKYERVEIGTILPPTWTDVSRNASCPGACSRPLDLADVTLPRAGAPALATVLPLTTRLRASVASNRSPALAVPELISEPTRTVIVLPAGMFWAVATSASKMNTETILSNFPSISSSFRTNPWQYYA